MNEIEVSFYKTIVEFAKKENENLSKFNKGIFDIPELAFSYIVGKEIASNLSDLGYTWKREYYVDKVGFIDFAFTNDTLPDQYFIEFKMDDTYFEYKRDIDKLSKLNEDRKKYHKFLCALKWLLNEGQANDFKETMINEFEDKAILKWYEKIKTSVNSKDACCLVSFWEIK